MKAIDFCNWLDGYLGLENPGQIDKKEIEMIKRHLDLALKNENEEKARFQRSLIC